MPSTSSSRRSARMPDRRVAITGIGPVTPVGIGRDAFWDALMHGRSGAHPLTRFDTENFPVRIAAEIDDFDASEYLPPKRARKLERFSQFAYAAAKLALDDASLEPSDPEP